jgi:hypothetical protein
LYASAEQVSAQPIGLGLFLACLGLFLACLGLFLACLGLFLA